MNNEIRRCTNQIRSPNEQGYEASAFSIAVNSERKSTMRKNMTVEQDRDWWRGLAIRHGIEIELLRDGWKHPDSCINMPWCVPECPIATEIERRVKESQQY